MSYPFAPGFFREPDAFVAASLASMCSARTSITYCESVRRSAAARASSFALISAPTRNETEASNLFDNSLSPCAIMFDNVYDGVQDTRINTETQGGKRAPGEVPTTPQPTLGV